MDEEGSEEHCGRGAHLEEKRDDRASERKAEAATSRRGRVWAVTHRRQGGAGPSVAAGEEEEGVA